MKFKHLKETYTKVITESVDHSNLDKSNCTNTKSQFSLLSRVQSAKLFKKPLIGEKFRKAKEWNGRVSKIGYS